MAIEDLKSRMMKERPHLKAQVDLNRNFPLGFGLGADAQPCSEVYKGQVGLVIKLMKATKMKLLLMMRVRYDGNL